MAEIRVLSSLHSIARADWNLCFPGVLEDYDYLVAVEASGMTGFAWRYLAAYEDETLIAAIPAFLTDYALETTLEGSAKKIMGSLRKLAPGMMTLKLACLGSPVTEYGLVGFHPAIAQATKSELLARMLAAFEAHTAATGHTLIGLKDIPEFQQAIWAPVLARGGYHGVSGMPVAQLDIDFTRMDDYLSRLSAATRKDMRRKLRAREGLRIEYRHNIDDVLTQVMALYQSTRNRADMQLEELTPAYFQGILSRMGGRALCVLYFAGDELLGANLLLRSGATLLDKFFCMDARGREHNLYFVSWFTNIEYCLAAGVTCYQSGQAGYDNKLRLGSSLTRTYMHFKHRNRWVQGALRIAAPFLAADDFKEAA
jgi:predicted N-acyltransferase